MRVRAAGAAAARLALGEEGERDEGPEVAGQHQLLLPGDARLEPPHQDDHDNTAEDDYAGVGHPGARAR